jgi:predicted nucleic acid-binding protein
VRLLPDTSVWVDYLKGRSLDVVAALDQHLERESVLVCGPVIAELLAGTRPDQREDLWLGIGSLPWAVIDQPAWRAIGETASELRRAGISVPLTDVAIAVAAANAEAELWTGDADFEQIRTVLPQLVLHEAGEAA